ncbi:MAG: hypothetical protein LIP05_02255 [Tannerellaceae bacterium]|nr:hypothetical protein [Tannerellaceae bacterium]
MVTVEEALRILYELKACLNQTDQLSTAEAFINSVISNRNITELEDPDPARPVTRKEFALLLDQYVDPFESVNINMYGEIMNHGKQ